MKLATFDDLRPGLVVGDDVYDLVPLLPGWRPEDPAAVHGFLAAADSLRPAIEALVARTDPQSLSAVTLRAPSPLPGQVLAAPLNFQAHRDEMTGPLTAGSGTANELGFFLKSSRSVSDPVDPVLLPDMPGRRFDFEAEVAVVIGRTARGVSPEDALDHVLGYTLVLDMTLRMTETERQERTQRKSYATFTPMGPWITTADEVPDPSAITLRAWRNDELRQEATLKDLIVDVPELVSRASHVLPLEPGDVYATGSPAGVGQVQAGDVIRVESPMLGSLVVSVETRPW